jgi:hypothetical protein
MGILQSAIVLLALVWHLGANASENGWIQQSRRDYFYVGGEYTNLTVSLSIASIAKHREVWLKLFVSSNRIFAAVQRACN